MEDLVALETLGLRNNERKVYLTLVELGSSSVSSLVKKTGIYRSYVYDILDKLIEMGLVGVSTRNNKKYFVRLLALKNYLKF